MFGIILSWIGNKSYDYLVIIFKHGVSQVRVAIIGTGYVGLVVGAGLTETGNYVCCVDIDKQRVAQLRIGEIPIFEPRLEPLVKSNVRAGRLTFSTDTRETVKASEVVFLAVPTPMDEDGSADLQHVIEAAREVAEGIDGYTVIVDKSTVPVGTAEMVRKAVGEITDQPFDVVSNPEFLKEGNAVEDFLKPDRVIIGCDNPKAEAIMRDLYAPFVRTGHPIISMKIVSAELTKYAANAFLATKISFINELARLCDLVGADIGEIRTGIGTDSRIGSAFLFPGMGFGGSCFPKDLRALDFTATNLGLELQVVRSAISANELQKQFIPGKIQTHFESGLKGLNIAVWGLAFKANTDDIRESPALPLIDFLLENEARVTAYDPQANGRAKALYKDTVVFTADSYSALQDADALVVATDWNEFRHPDFNRMLSLMHKPVVFDGRNLYKPAKMKELGFFYYSVGQSV